jgi:hypothetical protein
MKWYRASGDNAPRHFNCIFMEGTCFAETNIHLAGVALCNLTYFNFIIFNLT